MNRLPIMLNNRKRFVFLAAIAAVLVLLSGGANALAIVGYTVRCVPSHTINANCTATDYPTIQAAVTAAVSGDIVLVAAGYYNESVVIDETGHSRDHLSLLGAQAGNDARVGRHDPSKESIVDGTGTGNSTIIVEAEFVVVDGFTAQGGTQGNATGIDLKGAYPASPPYTTSPGHYGVVVNNILTNNCTGVSLNSEGSGSDGMGGAILLYPHVEHNLFVTNNGINGGPPGCGPGNGVYTTGVLGAVITENAFCENKTSALGMNYAELSTIANNTSEKDASFVHFTNSIGVTFSNNQGKDFAAKGILGDVTWSGDGAISIGPNNVLLEISDNSLEEGTEPVINGIAFTTVWGAGLNEGIYVKNNEIERFPGNGITAETGMLTDSFILGNQVDDNGADGIGIAVDNGTISLFDNEAEGNAVYDCEDATAGAGTLGTADTWFNNAGKLSSPAGLCTSEKVHHHHH